MQSEFACHIGLRGKFFCRACWVKGHDGLSPEEKKGKSVAGDEDSASRGSRMGSDVEADSRASSVDAEIVERGSQGGSEAGSEAGSSEKKGKGRAKKAKETLAGLIQRAKDFIKVCFQIIHVLLQSNSLSFHSDRTPASQGGKHCKTEVHVRRSQDSRHQNKGESNAHGIWSQGHTSVVLP